ncbi:hypothetical protein HanRHA438_Chr13g0591961 [Helianthus annuus]|nr:hypothetical protein HanRHA438_Chr13g0591961 [Helianthus annuus]
MAFRAFQSHLIDASYKGTQMLNVGHVENSEVEKEDSGAPGEVFKMSNLNKMMTWSANSAIGNFTSLAPW